MKVVTLCSGGLDSVTLAHYIKKCPGWQQTLLFVNYGQKHLKESVFAKTCADDLGLRLVHVHITWLGQQGMTSALTSGDLTIPTGPYPQEGTSTTVVPNRNAVMANLAASLAVSLDYEGIALAIHAGDHMVYPDTTGTFAFNLERLLCVAVDAPTFRVYAPWVEESKTSIVELGARMNVPFEKTWSCYEGGNVHCGRCGTCIERQEAFKEAGVLDPTVYQGWESLSYRQFTPDGKEETNATSDD